MLIAPYINKHMLHSSGTAQHEHRKPPAGGALYTRTQMPVHFRTIVPSRVLERTVVFFVSLLASVCKIVRACATRRRRRRRGTDPIATRKRACARATLHNNRDVSPARRQFIARSPGNWVFFSINTSAQTFAQERKRIHQQYHQKPSHHIAGIDIQNISVQYSRQSVN